MYNFLATLYPENLRKRYNRLLAYAGIAIDSNRFLGFILFFGFGVAFAMSLFLMRFVWLNPVLLLVLCFALFEIITYFVLVLRADKKGKLVEDILPDALQLMASNLRAGITTDRALLLSARPEFGPFQDEMNRVGKEVMIGRDISESLLSITESISSEKLRKTILLIVTGLNSGGELASLLEQTSANLRQEMFVEERVKSSVMMYVIFIFGAVAMGSPLLFGLSSFLIEIMTKSLASIQLPETTMGMALPLRFSNVAVSTKFITTFAIISLTTSSIFGSLIVGLISNGREREGLKLMPILILMSVGIFFAVKFLIKNMLGGLFGL